LERHLLVTVSEQQSALHGVRYAGHFFSNKESLRLTLFYTAPRGPVVWEGERSFLTQTEIQQQAEQYKARGRRAIENAKSVLHELGFRREQIAVKLAIRFQSKAMDIIREGENGLYDAVVLGRRGLSWLEEAFDESVSKGILKEEVQFPIWICRRPRPERRDVLLCVDGSEAAYRMADHVGFILAPELRHRVTILQVMKTGTTQANGLGHVFVKSKEILMSNNFPPELIQTSVVEASNIARAVLKKAKQGNFAAVATGRTGGGKGLLKNLFMGSVSTALFREMEGAALWVTR
jgi:nucleotide-binding universal stress UspA family protein